MIGSRTNWMWRKLPKLITNHLWHCQHWEVGHSGGGKLRIEASRFIENWRLFTNKGNKPILLMHYWSKKCGGSMPGSVLFSPRQRSTRCTGSPCLSCASQRRPAWRPSPPWRRPRPGRWVVQSWYSSWFSLIISNWNTTLVSYRSRKKRWIQWHLGSIRWVLCVENEMNGSREKILMSPRCIKQEKSKRLGQLKWCRNLQNQVKKSRFRKSLER